ncbi:MAG: amidase [Acidobacteriota bacterium]|nr:amidase [Acidobacteriota bacterium]
MSNSRPFPDISQAVHLERRRFLAYFSGVGLTSTLFPGILWAHMQQEQSSRVTAEMIRGAEQLSGVEFTPEEREEMVQAVNQNLERYDEMRKTPLSNGDWPALQFNPALPGMHFSNEKSALQRSNPGQVDVPANLEEVAFWPVTRLSRLVESRKITSLELTNMYLRRLKRYDPKLECVITLTEDLAMMQAHRADQEIAMGRYRGPLHGIPWGVKDLLATKEYPTTWGAEPYKDQKFDFDATIVERLEGAGAVLVAKLATGALASGDTWFGGRTVTPWNTQMGTRGSSAGPGAATAAGLVGFSIGTETRGSIIFPSTRCGLSGLRPTFGRVSRYGVMAISFSMDKAGPMCRSVEDCALVFDVIEGPDDRDLAVVDLPFNWDSNRDIRQLRVGYIKSAFEADQASEKGKANGLATLEKLRVLGLDLIPVEFPDYPVDVHRVLLYAEATAAFDELNRSGRDKLLKRPNWAQRFRMARTIPAVEYIQADRHRLLLMKEMNELFSRVDIVVVPPSEPGTPTGSPLGRNTPLTNLTGHPCVVVPNGFVEDGTPSSMTFVGKLYAEAEILALAKFYQDATGFHLQHPVLD